MSINQACRILLKPSSWSRRSIEHVALCSSPSDRRVDQMSLSYLLKHSSWSRRSIEHVAFSSSPSDRRVDQSSMSCFPQAQLMVMSIHRACRIVLMPMCHVNQSSISYLAQAQLMVTSIHRTCGIGAQAHLSGMSINQACCMLLKPSSWSCRCIEHVAFSSSPSDRYVNQSSMSCFPQAQLMVMSIHQTCRIVFMSI